MIMNSKDDELPSAYEEVKVLLDDGNIYYQRYDRKRGIWTFGMERSCR